MRSFRQGGHQGGFISHYLIQVIYPPGLTRGIRLVLGLGVVLIAMLGYTGYLRRHVLRRSKDGR